MRTLMPEAHREALPRRRRRTIVEDQQDVTVLFADIVGFEEFGRELSSEEALDLLNDIVRAFDEAAEQHGVERVRTTRQGYLASCGLGHAARRQCAPRRGVRDGAGDASSSAIARSRARHLGLRVGIDTGTVTSGLVGRARVVYDMWGDAVNLAFRCRATRARPGIYITQRVADRLPDDRCRSRRR